MSEPIKPTYEYNITIVKLLDADTADVELSLGFDLVLAQRVRVFGINAREVRSTNQKEKAQGLRDLEAAKIMLPVGLKTVARTHKNGQDKFGRWLAELVTIDGKDFATEMIAAGHAKPWDGQGAKPT